MTAQDPEQPRDLGEIPLSEPLRRLLAALRARDGVTGVPELCADRLHAVETAVGYRFASDLLAVYAAAVPTLARNHELTLDRVVGHTGALAATGAPGDLIGLGRQGEEYLALEKRLSTTEETRLRRVLGGLVRGEPIPLVAWLESVGGETPPDLDPPSFRPQLLRTPPSGSSGRRVLHPVFGEGRVYLESGAGPERKVKVDFPGAGLKIIQARFLEFLDD